jgi:hypothetical protein
MEPHESAPAPGTGLGKRKKTIEHGTAFGKHSRAMEEPTHIVYPLAGLKCLSPKRRLEIAARLGGEPSSARRVEFSGHGYHRPLLRSDS